MYYSDRVKLIRRVSEKNERGVSILDPIGNPIFTEEVTEVWGDRISPTRAESTAAGAQGLVATDTIKVHTTDYSSQTMVELDGRRLSVYRTFKPNPDEIELHVGEKRGDAGGH